MIENKIKKTTQCGSCQYELIELIDLFSAAFDHSTKVGEKCPKCGGRFQSSSKEMPPLSDELMELWIKNENLLLLDQDEELVLSGEENFERTIRFIDRVDALMAKRVKLVASLCVNIYDESLAKPKDQRKKLLEDSIEAVRKRADLLNEDELMIHIMPYIRKVVWPIIGLRFE
jgi:hypothetical protein